jgi:protein TonB
MERPTLQRQVIPIMNQAAMAARLEATALVKCVITEDGSLTNCRIVKHLPLEMDGPLLAAVSQWKYTPDMFQGRPQKVDYMITVHVKPP